MMRGEKVNYKPCSQNVEDAINCQKANYCTHTQMTATISWICSNGLQCQTVTHFKFIVSTNISSKIYLYPTTTAYSSNSCSF